MASVARRKSSRGRDGGLCIWRNFSRARKTADGFRISSTVKMHIASLHGLATAPFCSAASPVLSGRSMPDGGGSDEEQEAKWRKRTDFRRRGRSGLHADGLRQGAPHRG